MSLQSEIRKTIADLKAERRRACTAPTVARIDRDLALCRRLLGDAPASPRGVQATRSATTDMRCRLAPTVPASMDEDGQTVDAVLATEDPCYSIDMKTGRSCLEVYLMPGGEWDDQVPLIDTHVRDSVERVLGSVRSIHVEGDRLVGTLCITPDRPDVWGKIIGRHLTDVSFGVQPLETVTIRPGDARTVAGRSFDAPDNQPLFVHTAWRLREVSLTPIGSDARAKIRSL